MNWILVLGIALVVLFLVTRGVKIVPQADNWLLERFGKYVGTLKPGLNFINPLFSKVASKIDIREQVLDLPSQSIITSDNATVNVNAVVFYKILDPYKAFYGIESLNFATANLAKTTLRSIMGKMALDETLSNREKINNELLIILDEATDAWGTKITRVELQDITPPQDIGDAMARQMKAERERRATVLEAEAERESAEKRAEGFKRAQILEAEARKEAAMKDAEARELLAKAEAKAIEMVSKSLVNGNPEVYLLGREYIKSLNNLATSSNSKFIMLPPELMESITKIFGKK